jgi:hypothetical protein
VSTPCFRLALIRDYPPSTPTRSIKNNHHVTKVNEASIVIKEEGEGQLPITSFSLQRSTH